MPVRSAPSTRARPARIAARSLGALLVVLAAACAPGTSGVLAPPTFHLVTGESGLVRLDLPGFGAGGATFRLALDAVNPNPIALRLAALDGDFHLGGASVAATSFDGGVDLPAGGRARLTLVVEVPVDALGPVLGSLADVLAGRGVAYRLDGTVGVEVLGTVQRFPAVTLAQGTVAQDVALRAPEVSFDASSSGVRSVSFDRVTIDLALRVRNPNVVSAIFRAPDVRLRIGERDVATVQLVPERLPAGAETVLVQRVIVNPVQLGAAVVTQLQALAGGGGGSVEVVLTGRWEVEVPGVRTASFGAGELLRARLD